MTNMHGNQRINESEQIKHKKVGHVCSVKEMDALTPKNFTWTCLGFKVNTPPPVSKGQGAAIWPKAESPVAAFCQLKLRNHTPLYCGLPF